GSGLSANAAWILVDIVEHADRNGAAYPSLDRLARNSGMNKRTVQRALRELLAHELAPIAQRIRGHHASAEYVVTDTLRSTRSELAALAETRQARHGTED